MQITVGNTKKVTITVDDDMAELVSSRRWCVHPNLTISIHEPKEQRGRFLQRLIVETKSGPLGQRDRVKFIDGDTLNFKVENLEVSRGQVRTGSKGGESEPNTLPEGIVPLKKNADTDRQKYQAAIKVNGITRYVGKVSTSLKKVMAEHDRYALEHSLNIPLLLPVEDKPKRNWEYIPPQELSSQTFSA